MIRYKHLTITAILLVSGCVYNTRSRVDQSVGELGSRAYDQQPPAQVGPPATPPAAPAVPPPRAGASAAPRQAMDVRTVAWLQGEPAMNQLAADQQPASPEPALLPAQRPRLDLNIPPEVPGSEARRIELSKDPVTKQRQIEALFPVLPPLVAEPMPLPGPGGRPFTLSDFQQIAVVNSPQLKQAASDVEAARGNMLQANAYPNPTLSYQLTPSSNGSTPGGVGVGIDQTIKTGGKLRLQEPPRPRWSCTTPNWP